MSHICNNRGSELNLFKADIVRACNADDNAAGILHRGLDKGTADSRTSRLLCLITACSNANAHMSIACIRHNRLNIGKVKVYKSGYIDKLGNALNALTENIVRNVEGVFKGNLLLRNELKALVGDNNKAVHLLTESRNTRLGLSHTLFTLKSEGLCNDTYSKDTELLCDRRNNGSRTCTCAAAHTCGNENHICTADSSGNLVP